MVLGVVDVQHRGIAVSLQRLRPEEVNPFLLENDVPRALITVDSGEEVTFRRNRHQTGRMEPPALEEEVKSSFLMAVRYATWIGPIRRKEPVLLGMRMLEDESGPFPQLRQGSLFGATALLLMQESERGEISEDLRWADSVNAAVRGTQLQRIAVSAAFDPWSGEFKKVESLENKLDALARLHTPPAAVVLAQEQDDQLHELSLPFLLVHSSDPI